MALINALLLLLVLALIVGIAGGVLYGRYWYEIGGMLMALALALMRLFAGERPAKNDRVTLIEETAANDTPPPASMKRTMAERKAARAERKRRNGLAGDLPTKGR
jgi:hypothetical protein